MAVDVFPILIVGIIIGMIPIWMLGRIYWNPYKWAAFRSRMTKKSYGVVKFRSHGKNIYSRVMNLSNDTIKTKFGLFIIEKDCIYRQVGQPTAKKQTMDADSYRNYIQGNGDMPPNMYGYQMPMMPDPQGLGRFIKKGKAPAPSGRQKIATIEDKHIEFEHGVPIITFDLDDMLPLEWRHYDKSEENRNPRSIQSTLEKEIEVAKMLAIKMSRKQLFGLMVLTVILVGGAIMLGVLNYQSLGSIEGKLQYLNQTLQQAIPAPVIS